MTSPVEGIEQLNTLTEEFATASGRVGELGAAIIRKGAHDIEATGKLFCPVDTGATRDSIGTDFAGDGRSLHMEAVIGPTTNYAPYLEHGTENMAPRAFMGPAYDRHAAEIVAALLAASSPLKQ